MFSSPLLRPPRTRLPAPLRERIGQLLGGPPRGGPTRPFRAAIFQLDRLGDFVLTLSAVRTMLATWGADSCLLVVSRSAAPLAALEFPHTPRLVLTDSAPGVLHDLLPLWRRERPLFRGLACERVVCLSHHRDLYKQVALSWLRTPQIHQLDRSTYPTAHAADSCLELTAHHQLTQAALGRPVSADEITPHFTQLSSHDGPELVVCPVSTDALRRLPDSVLLPALIRWRTRSIAPITFSGPPSAEAELNALAARLRAAVSGLVNIAVHDSFPAFAARLAAAGAVLATESAPGHFATALDKRAVVAVGGGLFGLCSPWRRSTRQVIAQHRTACYSCGWHCTQPTVACLTGLDPLALAAALPPL